MKRFLWILIIFALPSSGFSFLAKVTLEQGGEGFECRSNGPGWIMDDDVCRFEKSFEVATLPWSQDTGGFALSILKTGKVEIDFSVGDGDVVCQSAMQIPRANKRLMVSADPYFLELSCSDKVSSAWNGKGTINITIDH